MNQFQQYTTLTLHGKTYDKESLLGIAAKHINKPETPFWEQSLFRFVCLWLNDEDFVVVQTSGSTGVPKQIRLEKDKMVASAKATGHFFALEKAQTALLCLPCDYIAGKMMVVRSFVLGLNLIAVPPASQPLIGLEQQNFQLTAYEEKTTGATKPFVLKQIDFAAMIPLQVSTTLAQSPSAFAKMNQLIIGGGAISQTSLQALQNQSTRCYATYGMTETITHIAVKTLNGAAKTPYYQALKGVVFSQDERNCLVIDAPYLANEKIVTNDVVALESSSRFEWLGRFDNIINTGGVKINPEKVEEQLQKLLTQRFFIAALPDERLENKVILVIEGAEWGVEKTADFQQIMKQCLSKYAVPKSICFVSQFEETATGKIQRQQTLARYL